ncbi:hypothetical protein D3C76_771680 [compost metagenome]
MVSDVRYRSLSLVKVTGCPLIVLNRLKGTPWDNDRYYDNQYKARDHHASYSFIYTMSKMFYHSND